MIRTLALLTLLLPSLYLSAQQPSPIQANRQKAATIRLEEQLKYLKNGQLPNAIQVASLPAPPANQPDLPTTQLLQLEAKVKAVAIWDARYANQPRVLEQQKKQREALVNDINALQTALKLDDKELEKKELTWKKEIEPHLPKANDK